MSEIDEFISKQCDLIDEAIDVEDWRGTRVQIELALRMAYQRGWEDYRAAMQKAVE